MDRLIIFVKNPLPGQVKTRLGQSIGMPRAAAVYQNLLQHTHTLSARLSLNKEVWYGDFIHPEDLWNQGDFQKRKQRSGSLGERMAAAFLSAFEAGYDKVMIIGSDCPELRTEHMEKGLQALDKHEVVIGPARDGGYYLLGMRRPYALFKGIEWSTPRVLDQTLALCQDLQLNSYLLPVLSDLDDLNDLEKFPEYDA